MDTDHSIGSLLEVQSYSINLEEEKEEYILTPEDEIKILLYHLGKLKEAFRFHKREQGFSPMEIESKVAHYDFDADLNKKEILRIANSNKLQDIWHSQQRVLEKQNKEDELQKLKEEWTARTVFKLIKWTSRHMYDVDFIVNEHNKDLITALCYYLSLDPRFETDLGFSFTKGLWVRGNVGLGKTHIVRCAAENNLNPIKVLSMLEVTEDIQAQGSCVVNMEGRRILYLDDVGTEEPTVVHYGTRISWFKNFIETKYLKGVYNNLIISTNLSFSEIETNYGNRARSRIAQMFNVINVTGEDMRKSK